MDREKVIANILEDIDLLTYDRNPTTDELKIINDLSAALSLLKEQEAVEPTLIREGRNKYYNDYVCPRCDNEVVYEQNYCSECGIPFMWEGR